LVLYRLEDVVAIYMKYGSIDGPVTTKGFEKWIELNSFQFGVGRSISTAARSSIGRESSEPSISEITVTKPMDVSSNGLFQDAVGGDLAADVTIKFTSTTKDGVVTFLTYQLTNTGLSGYSASSGGDNPSESLSLNFTKVTITYSGLDPKTQGKPNTIGYDLTQMAKV
jgi:type VI secretion system secreted protein Hcp